MNQIFEFEKYILKKSNKVKISSKEISKGDIFLALKGKNFHGNQFINSSLRRGAKYCLTDNKNFAKNSKIIYVNSVINYLQNVNLLILKSNSSISRQLFETKFSSKVIYPEYEKIIVK